MIASLAIASSDLPILAALSGAEVRRMMRRYHVTIRVLAARGGVTMKRVREIRTSGVNNYNDACAYLGFITGNDPFRLSVYQHLQAFPIRARAI